MSPSIARGFTLIELLIALALFAFLIMLAGPMYAEFMGNMQIRNGAENTLTGVRLAQGEAVRGNSQAQFILDPTQCSGGWQVKRKNNETGIFDVVQSYTFAEGACKATVTPNPPTATEVTFNGLGRVIDNDDATDKILWVEVTNGNSPNPRTLRVVINPATPTGIKLCDPDPRVAANDPNDPRICPAT